MCLPMYIYIYIYIYIHVCASCGTAVAAIGDWDAGSDGVGSSMGVGRKPSSPTVGHFLSYLIYIYIHETKGQYLLGWLCRRTSYGFSGI